MSQFIAHRLLLMVPVWLFLSIGVFSLVLLLPGDPVLSMLGEGASPDQVARLRSELGLDLPIYQQYLNWLARALQGDFGTSLMVRGKPVVVAIAERLPVTIELALLATLLTYLIAIPVGIYSALRRGSAGDAAVTTVATFALALPNFWFAILLILLFSFTLGWLPSSGWVPIQQDLVANLKRATLPVIALGLYNAAVVLRFVRSSLLEVLGEPYITTAHAKGLPSRLVVYRHALRSALIPVVTVGALILARILSGTVVVEVVFAIPGAGRLVTDAIMARDFLLVQALVLFFGTLTLLINLSVDVAYRWLDPRIKHS